MTVRRVLILIILLAAVLQWSVVLERLWAATWAWYEFAGYGGGGHIVVGRTIQGIFLLGSTGVAAVGYAVSKAEPNTGHTRIWRKLAQVAWTSICVCTLIWILVLVSPLVTFRIFRIEGR